MANGKKKRAKWRIRPEKKGQPLPRLSVAPTIDRPERIGAHVKLRTPAVAARLLTGPDLQPEQAAATRGACKVKMPRGFSKLSAEEKSAARQARKRPWQVDLVFIPERFRARIGIAGPALRLCVGYGKPGPLVPVSSLPQAQQVAERFKSCVLSTGKKKACAREVAGLKRRGRAK